MMLLIRNGAFTLIAAYDEKFPVIGTDRRVTPSLLRFAHRSEVPLGISTRLIHALQQMLHVLPHKRLSASCLAGLLLGQWTVYSATVATFFVHDSS